jgi:hypothetical protein
VLNNNDTDAREAVSTATTARKASRFKAFGDVRRSRRQQ